MTIKTNLLTLLPSLLLLSACAHQPACQLPAPPQDMMAPTGPDMLKEMQSILTPSLTTPAKLKNTGAN